MLAAVLFTVAGVDHMRLPFSKSAVMKNRKIRIVLIAAVLLVSVFASASVSFAASGTKVMTAYSSGSIFLGTEQ